MTVWSSGSGDWALRSTIGYAASKTIREGQRDTPYLANWSPYPID
jgi:hypothetical protein